MEKAYKLLALQEKISNKKAKELIDRGVVYAKGRKVKIARALISENTKFRVEYPHLDNFEIIFEDKNLIGVNKPPFVDSYEIEKSLNAKLIHRLDKETSGVLLLAKSDDFLKRAIEEFKAFRVKKIYSAWVEGIISEEIVINKPIETKRKGEIKSFISKSGKDAITYIYPDIIHGKKSKVLIEIKSGRTHQIRVHLASINHPIVGDVKYGSKIEAKRLLLHAKKIELLGYLIEAKEPKDMESFT
ncbi:MAG: RNA pseudouridine synthase [Epsilonproteobacteria bacterium]|nr:RNA pseudouridine synthase [Campylobacterota bacterium]